MAHQHRFTPGYRSAGIVDRLTHSGGNVVVRLTPTRAEWIPQVTPRARLTKHAVTDADALTLEDVIGLDSERFGDDVVAVHSCHRCGSLLRTFHRRGNYRRDVVITESFSGSLSHQFA
jgi:hypothetical protein